MLSYFPLELTFWMGRIEGQIVSGFMSQPRTLMQDNVIVICEKDCKFGTSAKATLAYRLLQQTYTNHKTLILIL